MCALFVLSVFGIIIGAITTFTVSVPSSGGNYVEGTVGGPRFINPLYSDNNPTDKDLVNLLYAGLVRFDGENISPDLAKEWTISDDGKIYTFTIKDGIKWPDGKPFSADDVVYTLTTIQNPEYQSSRMLAFKDVKITKIDDSSIKIELPKAFDPFIESMTVGILPKHIWSNITPESIRFTDFNLQPMGLGPYRFKKLKKTKFGTIRSYTMERNERYHLGAPLIETITMKFFNTQDEAIKAFNQREVDGLSFISPNTMNQIKRSKINPRTMRLPQYTAVFFNLSSNSPITNREIRKALAKGIDKSKLLRETLNNQGRVIGGPLILENTYYDNPKSSLEFDAEESVKLLEKEGWTKSDDGILKNKDGKPLALKLTTADTPELVAVATFIMNSWKSLGVSVELRVLNTDTIQRDVISPRDFEILLFGQITGLNSDPYPFWHSSQISRAGLNLSNFKSQSADKLLEGARNTSDKSEKTKIYEQFQGILTKEIPAVFLYNPDYIYPVDNRVKGIDEITIMAPSDRFARVRKWYIDTKRVLKNKNESSNEQ